MVTIDGRHGLGNRLGRCDLSEILADALANAAAELEAEAKEAVSRSAGESGELGSGLLRDSIKRSASADVAVVGSDDPAAVARELGTHDAPPRPFLAPAASKHAERVARSIAISISDLLGASLD